MDELEGLVVHGKEMDQKLVAEILSPYLQLDKDACNIRPLKGWRELKADLKILLYLLARKAMVALDFGLEVEGAKASEVARDTGVKQGTANPALRWMFSDRILEQTSDRRYFIPNHAIQTVKSMLSE